MQTVGTAATDWANDGLFGDGWHLFGIGSSQAAEAEETYGDSDAIIEAFNAQYGNDDIAEAVDLESENYSEDAAKAALAELVNLTPSDASVTYSVQDEETLEITETPDTKKSDLEKAVSNYLNTDYKEGYGAPDAATYGIWVPGIPVLIGNGLDAINCADWLNGLILDGIVAGVGAVLGFVPQMLVLFILLAFSKVAVIWLVSHSYLTVSSVSSVFRVSRLSQCLSAQAAVFRVSWRPVQSRMSVTAV